MPRTLPVGEEEARRLDAVLSLVEFMPDAGPAALARTFPSLELRDYADGEPIVVEGETTTEFFVLVEGAAAVTKARKWLWPERLALLAPGAVFGEVGFLVESPRSASVTAKGGAKVFAFGADDMRRVLGEIPRLAQRLSELAKARLSS